jgi:hypothetical protein
MEILTLMMLLAKSVLLPFQEQSTEGSHMAQAESVLTKAGRERPARKRMVLAGRDSRVFRPNYHCPQPAM